MMFAGELHVMPWDIGRLTVEQFDQAIRHFDKLREQAAEMNARSANP